MSATDKSAASRFRSLKPDELTRAGSNDRSIVTDAEQPSALHHVAPKLVVHLATTRSENQTKQVGTRQEKIREKLRERVTSEVRESV